VRETRWARSKIWVSLVEKEKKHKRKPLKKMQSTKMNKGKERFCKRVALPCAHKRKNDR
jgi:hypothetical protein